MNVPKDVHAKMDGCTDVRIYLWKDLLYRQVTDADL